MGETPLAEARERALENLLRKRFMHGFCVGAKTMLDTLIEMGYIDDQPTGHSYADKARKETAHLVREGKDDG